MKTGILGGTFDPVHLGHLHIADAAYEEYALDEVWFMPAGDPYFKAGTGVSDPDTRFAMTAYTLDGMDKPFICSDFEIHERTRTYTAETLQNLHKEYPEREFYFIMGLDSLIALKTWYEPDIILKNAVILCASRDSDPRETESAAEEIRRTFPEACPDIRIIHTSELNISSTGIRSRLAAGEDISLLVHPRTLAFIKAHHLYESADNNQSGL